MLQYLHNSIDKIVDELYIEVRILVDFLVVLLSSLLCRVFLVQ